MAVPGVVREHYLEAIGALIERYRRELGAAGIDYQLLDTDQPLELALLAYLSTRSSGRSDAVVSLAAVPARRRSRPRCRSCCTC